MMRDKEAMQDDRGGVNSSETRKDALDDAQNDAQNDALVDAQIDVHEGAQEDAHEDVAGLYSWAHLEGAKYRDFSASREEARAQTRQRGQMKAAARAASVEPAAAAIPVKPQAVSPGRRALSEKLTASPMGPRRLPSPAQRAKPRTVSREVPRWVALKTVFDEPEEISIKETPPKITLGVPCLALVSLAGGVGKTTLAASLSRFLSAEGRKVLVVDTHSYGLLPLFFGTREVGLGNLRTFSCEPGSASITVMTVDPEKANTEPIAGSQLVEQIALHAEGTHSVLIDVASGSTATIREILRLSPTMLFVLTPDMASMVSLQAVQSFLQTLEDDSEGAPQLYYVLNRFDESLPLHDYVREVLSAQLGDRLLPFVLHHSHGVSEALAEGMTVSDYAPRSEIVQDLKRLSKWVNELREAASSMDGIKDELPKVRWSEG
jgi:cellulose synthase operon protein YhjQ